MANCNDIIHPFQTDPGTSQRQRVMENLLGGPARIDARSMADLLDFFVQLSAHISYYNEQMQESDWKPFFSNSLPFTIAEIIRFDHKAAAKQLSGWQTAFNKKPSVSGIQLLTGYIYGQLLLRVNDWQLRLSVSTPAPGETANTELPVKQAIDRLIKDKLAKPVAGFIGYANAATYWYCTKNYNFTFLVEKPVQVWNFTTTQLYARNDNFRNNNATARKKLLSLYAQLMQTATALLDAIQLLSLAAGQSLDASFLPLQEELKEKQPPHLAVLFAFLNMFRNLQTDLNGFTKKHLDFFYKSVLRLQPKKAVPDKVHIVAEIQKQLNNFLLEKGTLLKDGKDASQQDILFATDDELVINKTKVAEQRTLFLNNINVNSSQTLLEGVYQASDATKANGVDKEFKDDPLASRAALGAKWSKYTDPENKFTLPYPNARLGFILASPVLLLNEGTRTITITLACRLDNNYCNSLQPQTGTNNPCCDDPAPNRPPVTQKTGILPPFVPAGQLLAEICQVLNREYYYINCSLIAAAAKKGISKELEEKLKQWLITTTKICYCETEEKKYEAFIPKTQFEAVLSAVELESLKEIFIPQQALNLRFSGEKEWVAPVSKVNFTVPGCADNMTQFALVMNVTLQPDEPAVTFYNAESLKENFNTTQPLVKIELNDHIKLALPVNTVPPNNNCCEKTAELREQFVSLYHFFRNVTVIEQVAQSGLVYQTGIQTQVTGLRNLVVQSDENIENVNSPIRPFGIRPKIDANFYIGSQEIFSKNWQQLSVQVAWKDKPADMGVHYEFYDYEAFEDGSLALTEGSFKRTHAVLENGQWKPANPAAVWPNYSGRLFEVAGGPYNDTYSFQRNSFNNSVYEKMNVAGEVFEPFNIKSDYGFLRLTLKGVGFQHDRYAFVVARHMMALANLIDPVTLVAMRQQANEAKDIIDQMILKIAGINGDVGDIQTALATVQNLLGPDFDPLLDDLDDMLNRLQTLLAGAPTPADIANAQTIVNNLQSVFNNPANPFRQAITRIDTEITNIDNTLNLDPPFITPFTPANYHLFSLVTLADRLEDRIAFLKLNLNGNPALKAGLPKEPYTPVIKELVVNYSAFAQLDDINLIHLYPYTGTYKPETLTLQPTLFPTFCHEGNLFVGLSALVPGETVSLLFQLAEATADSEAEPETVSWYYLENNNWKLLRTGFEVLNDDTNGLTTSGIIKFALPANMTNENTILPAGLYWIRAAITRNSRSISEIISIQTQAVKATFTNTDANDKNRLDQPLESGKVSKLNTANSAVTKITQPYESFGGAVPEENGHFYLRVSELLRHKNRAIQKFDYERLTLEAFPEIFKAKCINHTYFLSGNRYYKDFTVAPGYVMLAVIPDLNRLKAGQQLEPRAPVSLLDSIHTTLLQQTSPFVRLKVVNPRYEKITICLRVKLLPGKDEVYYKEKLKQDVTGFLAPWAVGEYDKLTFGQPVNFSDMVRFLESRSYLDFLIDLQMHHAEFPNLKATPATPEIVPLTPRSILVAGDIDVCIDQGDCPQWAPCDKQDVNNGIPCCDHKPYPVNDYCKDGQID